MEYHTQYINNDKIDFNSLSTIEAIKYMNSFKEMSLYKLNEIKQKKNIDNLEYSFEEMNQLFIYIGEKLKVNYREKDILPTHVKNSSSYKENAFDFTNESLVLIFAFALYYGNLFCFQNTNLFWSVGKKDFTQYNKPVIKGFSVNNKEMEVISISNNLFRAYFKGDKTRLIRSYKTWKSYE